MTLLRNFMWISSLGLAACAAAPGGPPDLGRDLAGTRWVGVVDASAERRTVPRLEFVREGRLTGFTGCNMLSGTWSMQGRDVRLGSVSTTKRMCLGPEMDIERRLLAALGERTRVRLEGERLLLTSGTARFEFVPAPAPY